MEDSQDSPFLGNPESLLGYWFVRNYHKHTVYFTYMYVTEDIRRKLERFRLTSEYIELGRPDKKLYMYAERRLQMDAVFVFRQIEKTRELLKKVTDAYEAEVADHLLQECYQ